MMQLERQYGIRMSLGSVHRYMRILDIRSKQAKKYVYTKTKTPGPARTFPNVLAQNFSVSVGLPTKWVTDITYLPCKDGILYLSCIKDLSDKSIVSYHLSNKNDLRLVMQTLEKATGRLSEGISLHSDQGFQYRSYQFNNFIASHKLIGSMSRKGMPYDNAPMESFFSILKNEELRLHTNLSVCQMRSVVAGFIHYYNYHRPQMGLKKLTPIEYGSQFF